MENIWKAWEKVCSNGLNEKVLTDFIDQKKEEILESATFNYLKWDNAVKPNNQWGFDWGDMGGFRRKKESFDEAVDRLKEYAQKRFCSLSKNALATGK